MPFFPLPILENCLQRGFYVAVICKRLFVAGRLPTLLTRRRSGAGGLSTMLFLARSGCD